MADESSQLPFLGYAPEDIPKMTSGVISRTRVFEDLNLGRVRAKKIGKRDLITPEEARLQKLKPEIARAWSPEEIKFLLQARGK